MITIFLKSELNDSTLGNMWFQEDGATPYFANETMLIGHEVHMIYFVVTALENSFIRNS